MTYVGGTSLGISQSLISSASHIRPCGVVTAQRRYTLASIDPAVVHRLSHDLGFAERQERKFRIQGFGYPLSPNVSGEKCSVSAMGRENDTERLSGNVHNRHGLVSMAQRPTDGERSNPAQAI